MYCKLKAFRDDKLADNPDLVKVLAILKSPRGEPYKVVIDTPYWPACTNPIKAYKSRLLYHDPSLEKETGAVINNAYYMDYKDIEIIGELSNNKQASNLLEQEY